MPLVFRKVLSSLLIFTTVLFQGLVYPFLLAAPAYAAVNGTLVASTPIPNVTSSTIPAITFSGGADAVATTTLTITDPAGGANETKATANIVVTNGGTIGSLSSLQVNGAELLSGSVAANSDSTAYATALAAAITSNGYTASSSTNTVTVTAPANQGADQNGRGFTATLSGGSDINLDTTATFAGGVSEIKANTTSNSFTAVTSQAGADLTLNIGGTEITLVAGNTAVQAATSVTNQINAASGNSYTAAVVNTDQVKLTAKATGTSGNTALVATDLDYNTAAAIAATANITIPAETSATTTDHSVTIDGVVIDVGTSQSANQIAATIAGTIFSSGTNYAAGDYTVTNPSAPSANVTFTKNATGAAGNGSVTTADSSYGVTAQVSTFTPGGTITVGETYRINLNGTNYDYLVASGNTTDIVNGLVTALSGNPVATCVNTTNTLVTCTAQTPGTAFTTTGTSVVDVTAPVAFTSGSVATTGGTVVSGKWNSTNTGINVVVPVANDQTLIGSGTHGTIQLQASRNGGAYANVGNAYTIQQADLGGNVTMSLTDVQFEGISGFTDGDVYTFKAVTTDSNGNPTASSASSTSLSVDQTAPVISLTGSSPVSAVYGSTYSEQGATATDNIDSSVSVIVGGSSVTNTTTVGGYTVTYDATDAAGNAATQVTRTVNVTQKALSITATDQTKIYGDTFTPNGATQFSSSGLTNSDSITAVTLTSSGYTSLGSASIGTYSIVPSAASGSGLSNYAITYNNGTLTVTTRTLTVTADSDQAKIYGNSDSPFTYVSDGLVNSDSITGALTRDAGENVGVYNILVGSISAGANYVVSFVSDTFSIIARTLNITAAGTNKTYDGTTSSSVTFSSDALLADVNNLNIGGTAAFSDSNVGVGKTVSVSSIGISGSAAGNYTLASTTTTTLADITQALLTITANNQTHEYNGNVFSPFTVSYNGFVNGETSSVLGGSLVFSGLATTATNVGIGYSISPSGLTSSNYAITYNNGALDIVDTTAPSTFTVGSVTTTGGTVTSGYWNSTNTGADVVVPVANDATLTGGTIQLQESRDGSAYVNVGSSYTILVGDLNTNKTLSLTSSQVEGISGFSEGDTITFKAVITDASNNSTTGSASSTSLVVDQTAPSGIIAINSGASYTNTRLVTLSFTSVSSDVAQMEFANGTQGSFQAPVIYQTPYSFTMVNSSTNNADGSYTIRAKFIDAAGNTSSSTSSSINLDTVAPTVSITAPADGSYKNSAPTFTATASDATPSAGIASVKFQYKTATDSAYTDLNTDTFSTFDAVWTGATLVDGNTYNLRVVATDGANNQTNSSLVSFIYDTSAPVLSTPVIVNNTTSNNSYIKNGDSLTMTTTITDTNRSSMSASNITANLSGLTGSSSVNPNLYDSSTGVATWNITVSATSGSTISPSVSATDAAGNSGSPVSTSVTFVEPGQTPLSPSTTIDSSNPQIVVGSTTSDSVITIPNGVNNASLDLSNLPDISGGKQLTNAITLDATTSLGEVKVELPSGIIITGASGWDGTVNAPQVQANNSVSTPSTGGTTTASAVIEVGFGDVALTFDKAVRILIAGQAGRPVGYSRGSTFTEITNICTDDTEVTNTTNLASGGDCKITVGSDMVTWTKHFTKFVSYYSNAGAGEAGVVSSPVNMFNAPSCTDTKPGGAPSFVSAVAGANSVTLTWNSAPDPVTYYLITYGETPGAQTYGNPNVGGKGATSYTVNGLSGGKTYYFRIRAGNGCMPGSYSSEISATPGGGVASGPANGFIQGVLGAKTSITTQEEVQTEEDKTQDLQSGSPKAPEAPKAPQAPKSQAVGGILGIILGFFAKLFGK